MTEHHQLFAIKACNIVKCATCGLVRTIGSDSEKAPDAIYAQHYFDGPDRYLAREKEFRVGFNTLIDRFEKIKSNGRLLDIGCGVGLLLDVARQRGYQVFGTELSPFAANVARTKFHLDVQDGTLESSSFPEHSFDVVILNHVLEHIPEPDNELRHVTRLLKKDGIVVIGVPNFNSIFRMLIGAKWPSILPEQHLWHFTPSTLGKLCNVVSLQTIQSTMTDYHNYAKHLPKAFHPLVKFIETMGMKMNRADAMLLIAGAGH